MALCEGNNARQVLRVIFSETKASKVLTLLQFHVSEIEKKLLVEFFWVVLTTY